MLGSFLFLNGNICCGYALETPPREIRKILCGYPLLSVAMIMVNCTLSESTKITLGIGVNSVDLDQMKQNVACDQGQYCLPLSPLVFRLIDR